jgi:hypothetical protein
MSSFLSQNGRSVIFGWRPLGPMTLRWSCEIHTLATSRLTNDCWEDTAFLWSDEVAGDNSRNNSDSTDVSGKIIAMLSPNTPPPPPPPPAFYSRVLLSPFLTKTSNMMSLWSSQDSLIPKNARKDPNTISDGSIGSCSNQEWKSTRGPLG